MARYAANATPRWNRLAPFFGYSTGDTMILAGIIARTVGTGATLETYLHRHLFDPIGMGPMRLGFDGSGVWVGGAQADTTSRSFCQVRSALPARRELGPNEGARRRLGRLRPDPCADGSGLRRPVLARR